MWRRNPRHAPKTIAESTAASGFPSERAITQNVRPEIAATPGGEPVQPVEEVDHVHDRDDPGDRQRDPRPPAGSVWMPTNGSVKRSTQIPEAGGDARGGELPRELPEPRQAAEVVDDSDRHRNGRAEQQAAVLPAGVEEGERRHEDPEEEREPAEPRHRQRVDAPPTGKVDDAEPPRHPSHRRREDDDHNERDAPRPRRRRGGLRAGRER